MAFVGFPFFFIKLTCFSFSLFQIGPVIFSSLYISFLFTYSCFSSVYINDFTLSLVLSIYFSFSFIYFLHLRFFSSLILLYDSVTFFFFIQYTSLYCDFSFFFFLFSFFLSCFLSVFLSLWLSVIQDVILLMTFFILFVSFFLSFMTSKNVLLW